MVKADNSVIDNIIKEIEEIKKEFKGNKINPYCVLAFNYAGVMERRGYPTIELTIAVCKDYWTNKGICAVEAFHLDDEGKIVVDYHALRNF